MTKVVVASTAQWAQACSSAFVPLRVRSSAPGFQAHLEQQRLSPQVALTRVTSSASEVYRSADMVAASPSEDLLLSLQRSGAGVVSQGESVARLTPGTGALYDTARPYSLSFPAQMSQVVIQVPREALPLGTRGAAELTARRLPPGAAIRALTSLAGVADAHGGGNTVGASPAGESEGGEEMADALVAVLRAVLSSERWDEPPALSSELLLTALRAYSAQHCADPRLGPELLAQSHHVSLRLVQKVFAREGDSPAAFIRRSRLALASTALQRGAGVTEAAVRCGFTDTDSFTRAFKREYGTTPSAFRAQGGAA